jgi:hypothetical protein
MKDREFDDILSLCLDRMLKGESAAQCLRDYPELAAELKPLLSTAQAAKRLSAISPNPAFRSRARSQFQSALVEMQQKKQNQKQSSLFHWHWRWQSRWAMAAMAFLAVALGGGSTVAAASNSMPDNTLYPVKLATERVQMALTFSDLDKAELNAHLADKRVTEIVYLTSKGDSEKVPAVAEHLNNNLKNLNRLVGDNNPEDSSAAPAVASSAEPAAAPSVTAVAPLMAPILSASSSPTPTGKEGATATSSRTPRAQTGTGATSVAAEKPKPKSGEWQELKTTVTKNAAAHEAQLNAALEKASPAARPALRQALDQSISEYDKAIKNLDQGPGGK